MLTTTGRKTGQYRTTPVLYLQDGTGLIVVASFGGNDMHPAWYLNLEQCPEAEIIIKGEHRSVLARKLSPRGEKPHLASAGAVIPTVRNLSTPNASRDSVDEAIGGRVRKNGIGAFSS